MGTASSDEGFDASLNCAVRDKSVAIPSMFSRENASSPHPAGSDTHSDNPGRARDAAPLSQPRTQPSPPGSHSRSDLQHSGHKRNKELQFLLPAGGLLLQAGGQGVYQASGSPAERRTAALLQLLSAGRCLHQLKITL